MKQIKEALCHHLLNAVNATWPDSSWRGWHHYSNRDSEKWASSGSIATLPFAAQQALIAMAYIASPYLKDDNVFADFDLYGAGLHEIKPGGYLREHLDSSVMETTGWSRTHSCVLNLNTYWADDWGGEFVIGGEAYKPSFNTMTLFRTTDTSLHEVRDVAKHARESRRTLALFFWTKGQPAKRRTSACFTRNKT